MLWADQAAQAGLVVEVMAAPEETAVARHLGADRFGAIKAVFASHEGDDDRDIMALRRAIDSTFHDALLLVDASATNTPPRRDWYADIVVSDPAAGLARMALRPVIAAE
jgi:hypothetical protein